MESKQFDAVVAESRRRQDALLATKGADYTRRDPDRLANFKRSASEVGVTTIQAWAIYAGKHWDAIMAFIKTGKTESEPIRGRLDDLHNYLYLLEGIINDSIAESPKQPSLLLRNMFPSHFGDFGERGIP